MNKGHACRAAPPRGEQAGFTLVEALTTVAIVAIAGTLLLKIWVQNNGFTYKETALISQGIGLNDTVSEISQDVKSALSVEASSSARMLALQIPSVDSQGNTINQAFDSILISVDAGGKILREQVFPNQVSLRKSSNRVLLTNLSLIQFNYLDSNNNTVSSSGATRVNFVINVSTQNGISTQETSASAKVNLRND